MGQSLRYWKALKWNLKEASSLSIRGESGCGKTTLLNLLARLEPADCGTLHWGDKKINASDKPHAKEATWRAKHIGVVYQSYYLIPELTVMENVLMSIRLSKLSMTEYRDRALGLLEQMGVVDKSRQIPAKLSGGEAAGCHSSCIGKPSQGYFSG